MVKTYSRIDWENEPSTKTPVNETNLNKMSAALDEIDNRVVSLDTTKASVSDVNGLVASIEFNEKTGVFTVTKKDGSKATFDTKLEKIAVNFEYDAATQKIIIYLDDGTTQEIDLSAFVTQYEFTDGDIVTWSVVGGKVTANIKENSIPGNKLEPNYLANCITAKNEAQAAAGSANTSKTLAESYAHGGTGTREGEDTDNAKHYMEQAKEIVGGNFVPTSRTINNKPLSADISLNASDVGALPASGGSVNSLNILQRLTLKNGNGAYEGGEINFDSAVNSNLNNQYIDANNNLFRFVGVLKDGRVTVFKLSMDEAVQADILHTGNISSKILPLNSTLIGLFSENELRAWIQANQYGAYFSTVDGYLFFSRDGRDVANRVVLHDATSGNDYAMLHTGNSKRVAIQSSAPTDTSSLWAW